MRPGFINKRLEKLELGLYRRSARVEAFTKSFLADLTRRGIPERKIDVVTSGANLELFAPRPRDGEIERSLGLEGRFVVGYIGTLGLAHRLENLLYATEMLKERPITFRIVGAGAEGVRLRQIAQERRLTNVVFVPRVDKNECPRYWSVCDVGIVHLRDADLLRTVIPSKMFEAMAMGLPVIFVGPDGEGSDLVRKHGLGLVVPPEDHKALAAAVPRLAEDKALWTSCAANSLAAAPLYSQDKRPVPGSTEEGSITLFGRFLRKHKLNRLPELWNLLRGDVTVVGPHIRTPEQLVLLTAPELSVLDLTPGLISPGSIKYRDLDDLLEESPRSLHALRPLISDSVRLSLDYAERSNAWTDFCVVLAAVMRVLFRGQFVRTVLRLCDPACLADIVPTFAEEKRILEAALVGPDRSSSLRK